MRKLISLLLVLTVLFTSLVFASVTVTATQSKTYNFNRNYTLTGNPIDDIVAVANAQNGRTKADLGYTEAWCADFVSDCAELAGVGDLIPRDGYCGNLYNNIINAGGHEVNSPQKGDIIFYYCNATYCPKSGAPWVHVGIMTSSSSSIEGNSGGRVTSKSRITYTDMNGHTYGHSGTNSVSVKYVRPNYDNASNPVNIGESFYAFIINTKMWKHLTVEQNNNVDIRTEKAYHCADQVWNFLRQDDGSYKIVSLANGRCLDVEDNSSANYANVSVWPDNGGDNQRWFIYGDAPYYKLKAKCSDCVLDVNEDCSDDGTNIQMFYDHGGESQQFQIYMLGEESYAIDKGNDFTAPIFNLKNGMALENDNGNVVIKKETGMSKQVWRFERQKDGSYKISSCYDGKCIDVHDASHASGANVQVYGSNGNDNQRWYLYEANNYVMFQSKESGYFLDLYEGLDLEGTNIEVWHKNIDDPQIFNIYKGDECKLKNTTVTVKKNESNQYVFSWFNVYAKTGYDLKIWQNDTQNDNVYQIIPDAKSGVTVKLPMGTYRACVDAYNHFERKTSNILTFIVENNAILGDTDGDGEITISDVTMLQRFLAELSIPTTEEQMMCGDVDNSGELEVSDATVIQRYLADMTIPYEIGKVI